jgi:DNA-binding response OmpR family regulator
MSKEKKKILIIEDDKILSNAISIALIDAGFEVIAAFDGEEGLEKVKQENPNLILLDLIMPKKSGEDVLKQIRKENEVPILISTAKEDPETVARCLENGATGYFVKSACTLDDIIRKIKESFEQ